MAFKHLNSASLALQELNYSQALTILASAQLAGALYLHILNKKGIEPGTSRFLLALPAILLNLAAPLLFKRDVDATTIVLISFNTAWLSTFKILLWVLNRSALASKNLRAAQFTAMLLFPLTPVSESRRGRGRLAEVAGSRRMLVDGVIKLACLGVLARMLQHAEKFHPYPRAFLYGIALYFILSSIMDGPGALLSSKLGVPVSPHFDQPWLSSSVVSFWSRRWDLAAGNVLRMLIYEPIVENQLIATTAAAATTEKSSASTTKNPERTPLKTTEASIIEPSAHPESLCRVIGSSASFLTSGLVHECIFYYLTGQTSGGVWLSFFAIQIPVIMIERATLGYLKQKGVIVPRVVLMAFTVVFESVSSAYLFWGPAEKAGLVKKVVNNVDVAYSKLLRGVEMASWRVRGLPAPVWLRTATSRVLSTL